MTGTAPCSVPISAVCDINPRLRRTLDRDELVGFVGMANLDAQTAVASDATQRPYGEVAKAYTPFENGDVLVAKITPCFENGKIAQARTTTSIAFGSTEFHVLRPHDEVVDRRYLLHFLRRDSVLELGEMRMTGAGGQRRIPARLFDELEIPLPSIDAQKRIATVLDAVDALRVKRHQALRKLDALTQTIFIDMFGDPMSNPMGWPLAQLSELGDLDRGVSKHRPRNDPVLLDGPWPLIQTGDVSSCGGYLTRSTSSYSDVGLAQSKLWPAGTLCITIAANIAKTGILKFEACFPDSVVGFTARDPATVEYVRSFLNFLQPALEAQAPESAQKNINLKVLRNIKVPHPPLLRIASFAECIGLLNVRVAEARHHLNGLDRLFVSLQQQAFRGEL